MKLEWEDIDDYHKRAKVHGGWLVKVYEDVVHNMIEHGLGMTVGYDVRSSICFVPDTLHRWGTYEYEKRD